MKKAQAIRFWTALRETTEVEEVLSRFVNREGYGSRRTLERYAHAAKGFGEGSPIEELSRGTNWSIVYLRKIQTWWDKWQGAGRQRPQRGSIDVVVDAQTIQKHREMLMAPLLDLHEIGLLAFNNYDLAVWYSRTDPCWPVTKGQVCRQPDGSLTVRLDAAEKPEWACLQQHLSDHTIWAAINAWKEAAAADLATRLALLKEIIARIEKPAVHDGLGLPVDLDMSSGGGDRPAIGLPYAFALHQQLVARSVGLPHYPITPTTLWPDTGTPNVLYLERGPAVVSPSSQQRQDQWVQLPEAVKVADAYRRAEQLTREVQQHLQKLRLMLVFPRSSVCDVCREWAVRDSLQWRS